VVRGLRAPGPVEDDGTEEAGPSRGYGGARGRRVRAGGEVAIRSSPGAPRSRGVRREPHRPLLLQPPVDRGPGQRTGHDPSWSADGPDRGDGPGHDAPFTRGLMGAPEPGPQASRRSDVARIVEV